jgi:hypothetical protein
VGYEYDDNAKLALTKAEKKESMYTNNEKSGTMSKNKKGMEQLYTSFHSTNNSKECLILLEQIINEDLNILEKPELYASTLNQND